MIALITLPLLIIVFVVGYVVVSKFDKFMSENSKNKRKARKDDECKRANKK